MRCCDQCCLPTRRDVNLDPHPRAGLERASVRLSATAQRCSDGYEPAHNCRSHATRPPLLPAISPRRPRPQRGRHGRRRLAAAGGRDIRSTTRVDRTSAGLQPGPPSAAESGDRLGSAYKNWPLCRRSGGCPSRRAERRQWPPWQDMEFPRCRGHPVHRKRGNSRFRRHRCGSRRRPRCLGPLVASSRHSRRAGAGSWKGESTSRGGRSWGLPGPSR